MIKSAAFINECDGGINAGTLIIELGIHTQCTITESLFGHSLSGYICHPSLVEKAESLSFI
jgi:hypothetical protein